MSFFFLFRISTYNDSTLPIIQHFESLKLVRRVDAAKNVDEVSHRLRHTLFKENNFNWNLKKKVFADIQKIFSH